MKKIIILIPVYNDWESLEKLLAEINISIENIKNIEFQCIVMNDASIDPPPKTKVPSNISSLKIITMKENQGHGRCNAFGIRYLSKNEDYDYVILMDGDGEDRPEEIKLLVEKVISIPDISVVAKRIKRSEGYFFQFLYQVHKIITLIFTGKNVNFGNYSCLTKKDIKFLSSKKSLWSSFSGSIKYYIPKLNSINSIRGVRYFGPSKMSLFKLGIHSLSIISTFKNIVFVRSLILIFLISYLSKFIGIFVIILQLCLVLFGLLIFLVSLRENEKDFLNSDKNQGEVKVYTH